MHTKPPVKREADLEAIVIATLRRLGRGATSSEIWRVIDGDFDVSFETRRTVFHRLLEGGSLTREDHRDDKMPEPVIRLYRVGPAAELTSQGRSHQ